jgi:hypothetical protein
MTLASSSGFGLSKSKLAEIVVTFSFRFQWGSVPPPEMLAAYFAARSENLLPGDHWSDWGIRWPQTIRDSKDLSFVDSCEMYNVIELWFDPNPGDSDEALRLPA